MKHWGFLISALIGCFMLAVCIAPAAPAAPAVETIVAAEQTPAGYPVTVENCGHTLTFTQVPARVVTLYPKNTEIMLMLGLEDKIVGIAGKDAEPVWEPLQAAYAQLPSLTDQLFGLPREVLLSAKPDFVFDNSPDYFYDASQGFATIEELNANGAQVYSVTGRCGGGDTRATIESTFTDLRNIGQIFGVAERAETVIAEIEQRLAAVDAKLTGVTPLRFLLYDSGESPLSVWGPGQIANVVERAGGVNIFADLTTEYTQVSVEEALARNPEVIVVAGYDTLPEVGDGAARPR